VGSVVLPQLAASAANTIAPTIPTRIPAFLRI
jgi:hypothetical protein